MGVEKMNRISPTIKSYARQLRSEMTDAEQKLWQHLRMRQIAGLKFRRQHPCGPFILDFACLQIKLAIEVDGGQHNENKQKDIERTLYLQKNGWTVLRFWNNEVLQEIDAVLMVIHQSCHLRPSHIQHIHSQHNHPHPSLPPEMGKEVGKQAVGEQEKGEGELQ